MEYGIINKVIKYIIKINFLMNPQSWMAFICSVLGESEYYIKLYVFGKSGGNGIVCQKEEWFQKEITSSISTWSLRKVSIAT